MSSEEVQDAVGEAPTRTLEQRRAELARIIATPNEKDLAARELVAIDAQIAAEREAAAVETAKDRQKGLRRAHGSKRDQRERLLKQLAEQAAALAQTCGQLAGVEGDLAGYEREDAALSDRFGVSPSTFPKLPAPGVAPEAIEAARVTRRALDSLPEHRAPEPLGKELCEHKVRERRNYEEIAATEGHGIIQAAGLKPFAPLTEVQQRILAAREREQRMRQQSPGAPDLSHLPASISIAGQL